MSTEQAIKILLVDDRKEDLLSMEVILAKAWIQVQTQFWFIFASNIKEQNQKFAINYY